MPEDILTVLRALVDAAFKSGSITDLAHTDLTGRLDAAAVAADVPEPEPVAADAAGADEGAGFSA